VECVGNVMWGVFWEYNVECVGNVVWSVLGM